jgi:cob(I)alamin adenosyltransferase
MADMGKHTEAAEKKSAARRRGLLIVYTGDGKGKTTAAIGLLMRAWGRGLKVCMIQFIKAEGGRWGETRAAEALGLEWHQAGDGFTWDSKDLQVTIEKAHQAWSLAQEKISSGAYDLVALDEFTYPLHFDWIEPAEALDWLQSHRAPGTHVVVTGRNAPATWIEAADLVTEMRLIKHPYDAGVPAQPGIEF